MRRISISDVTMKASEQSRKFTLSFKEKIELAKLLDKLGADVIEIGAIKNKKIDSLLVKSVAAAVKKAGVALSVGQSVESVEEAWSALKEAKKPRLQVCAPMSPAQMEYFWHKKPAKMLDAVRELIEAARACCPDVEFVAGDAARSERDFLYQAVETAVEAGARAVTLCDEAGLMFPDEFAAFIEDVRAHVPALEDVTLGVMISDELSMAASCAAAAVRAGADEIKTASCGGVTRLDEFAAILRGRGDALGVECSLRQSEIMRTTRQIEWMCSTERSKNSPFDNGVREDSGALLTAHDDRDAVMKAVEKLGYELSEEDAAKVCEAFERIAASKGTVSARELDSIVASAAMQVPPTYRLESYVINCGNVISACAHMKLQRGEESVEGVCLGDGPIDAAFLALEQIIGHHYELDDFQIQAVTEGREALGETIVRLRSNGKLYAGRGLSTDIVGASIAAYINALNKIVYEEA